MSEVTQQTPTDDAAYENLKRGLERAFGPLTAAFSDMEARLERLEHAADPTTLRGVITAAHAEALRRLEAELLEANRSGDVVDAELVISNHRSDLAHAAEEIVAAVGRDSGVQM